MDIFFPSCLLFSKDFSPIIISVNPHIILEKGIVKFPLLMSKERFGRHEDWSKVIVAKRQQSWMDTAFYLQDHIFPSALHIPPER